MEEVIYGVDCSLPSSLELVQIQTIRSTCQNLVDRLIDPADDVVGDLRILRFLRARHGKVSEAIEWFIVFLETRLANDHEIEKRRKEVIGKTPDEFLEWFYQRHNVFFPFNPAVGRNADGHLLVYMRVGLLEANKFVEARSLESQYMLHVQMLEWTFWQINEWSRQEGRMVYVVKALDFAGLGEDGRKLPIWVPRMKSFMTTILQSSQKCYCEHDAAFLVLNTPLVFRILAGMVTWLFSAKQKAKIRILGTSSSESVRASLNQIVPVQFLPVEWGGDNIIQGVFPPPTDAEKDAFMCAEVHCSSSSDCSNHTSILGKPMAELSSAGTVDTCENSSVSCASSCGNAKDSHGTFDAIVTCDELSRSSESPRWTPDLSPCQAKFNSRIDVVVEDGMKHVACFGCWS